MKNVSNKIQKAVQVIKNKIDSLKKSTQNNEVKIKVNNKEASKQISQLEKEIDSLQKKITSRQLKLDVTNNTLDKMKAETNQAVINEMPDAGNKRITQETYKRLDNDTNYNSLISQSDKLNNEIMKYNSLLDMAKSKMSELKEETNQTGGSQNKLTAFFNTLKGKVEQTKPSINGLKNSFNQMPKITKNITNNISKMGIGVKQGLGHILKYAGALLSLRGTYSTLSSCASTWLSSQNAGAKQLSANIDYMKYSMGSAFAPVIQYVINLIYQLMKAIQAVVYSLFKVNIFANASAKSYSNMAGSAKKAKQETKSLAGIHDEINNVQQNDNSNSGSGNSGGTPSFDLSGLDSQMSPFAQKLYDFFKPLKESWDNYGTELLGQLKTTAEQVGGLIGSVWGSFEKIITNGTVYTILENILAIIGNIAEAFSNAWNYNGNGDAIVQNLADAFNNLLTAINNVVQSEGFQNFLKFCSEKFREISEKLASINWQPLMDALGNIGRNLGTIALDILNGIVDIFKWLVEHPIVAEILIAIAVAIGILSTAYSIWSTVTTVLTTVQTALNISLLPLIAIITAIIAVIALIVLAIMNWSEISEWLGKAWEWLKQKAVEIFTAIGEFFSNIWQSICDTVTNIWNGIKEFFSNIWNGIKNTAVSIFNGIKDTISNVFNTIKNTISNIWNNIVNTISNVWNTIVNKVREGVSGAWNAITSVFGNIADWFRNIFTNAWQAVKNVFSTGGKIFDGIKEGIVNAFKSVVNAIINGINKVIAIPFNAINRVLNGIRNINILGVEPFTWIHTFNVPQIPQLAKGNVAYEPLFAMFGEYSGASNNPEITTPQNIMRETFEDVLANQEWSNNSDRPMRVQLIVGGKMFVDEIIDGINEKTRQTGKAQIKVAYE